MKVLILLLYQITFLMLLTSPSFAVDVLTQIPKDCNNNRETHKREGSTINIGPTWVKRCDSVCQFGKDGEVTKKITQWYPERSCDDDKINIITNTCIESSRHPGCFEIAQDLSGPLNHDCSTNATDTEKWHCVDKLLPVVCKYPQDGKTLWFRSTIGYGYCDKETN